MKLRVKYRDRPAVVVHRAAFKDKKLVYVGRANKRYHYPWGRSRIVYIGTTEKGARRVASSAAKKGEDLLFEHGIKEVEFSVVTCGKLRRVATWKKLERALLIKFRERYGTVPQGNVQGKKYGGTVRRIISARSGLMPYWKNSANHRLETDIRTRSRCSRPVPVQPSR